MAGEAAQDAGLIRLAAGHPPPNASSRVCRYAKPHALIIVAWNSQALLRADPCDEA
jgi:hypothetical protein